MLSVSLAFEQEPNRADNTVLDTVDGLGFYSSQDGPGNSFYVDEISFSSERREFEPEYVGPVTLYASLYHSYLVSSTWVLLVLMAFLFTTSAWKWW